MKSDLSLTGLAAELERRSKAKQDYAIHTSQIAMADDTRLQFQNGKLNQFEANDIAHNQIAGRLDIPVKYYKRLREKAPELLASNVNHWLHANPETRMIRTLDGQARAFLSDRYKRIENEQIASTVLPLLMEQEGVQVKSTAITETRMYIKAVFPHIQGEAKLGDVVQAGVAISNSEVGMGAVKIEPLVYRLVCLNGMIINDAKFSARHIGGRISAEENVHELLTEEAIAADDKAILLKIRDVVRASFEEARFARHLSLIHEATQDKLQGDPAEAVKILSKKQALNEFEQGGVLRHLIEGGDLSRWGILNAVTRTAQDVGSYDRATELETLGGNILTLPRSEWKVLAEAA